jgi:glycosyltransferase involved in cell wall biosynthesis
MSQRAEAALREVTADDVVGRIHVGIELRQVVRGASGGIATVVVGTLQKLFEQRPDIEFTIFCTVFNHELLAADAPNVAQITLPVDSFFDDLAWAVRDRGIDVLFRTYPTVEEVDFPADRQVFLLPDVQHEYRPEFFDPTSLDSRREAFRIALEGAGAIMTLSEHAKKTIEALAKGAGEVFVASPALPPEFVASRSEDATDAERAQLPAGEFFFFPANPWPHKNHERLFEALRLYRERTGRSTELVLTGSTLGWSLPARYADLPIRHLGFVSPALLRLIYERASALTFFSEYEGFGIPLLEAFELGTPVVCSNTTSLPEVAADAALMCDPTDIEAISDLLERVTDDEQLRSELAARGKRRLGDYAWANAADRLGSAIEEVNRRAGPPVGPLENGDRSPVSTIGLNAERARVAAALVEARKLQDELAAERDVQAAAAAARLEELEACSEALAAAHADCATHAETASARLAALEESEREQRALRDALEEREEVVSALAAEVETLRKERDLQAETAVARLDALESAEREQRALRDALEEREEIVSALAAEVETLREERDLQAESAATRLDALEAAERERSALLETFAERERAIEALEQDRDLHARAAAERLTELEAAERERSGLLAALDERERAIEALEQDRDLHAEAAAERLTELEAAERERSGLLATLDERERAIEAIEKDRALHAQAAAERLTELEAVQREAELRRHALDELASQRFFSG